MVFLRNHLYNFVHNVDLSVCDQIGLQLQVLLCFCYVPPCDSQYYSYDAFASIQEKITCNHMGNGYVIMGDMNTRFGEVLKRSRLRWYGYVRRREEDHILRRAAEMEVEGVRLSGIELEKKSDNEVGRKRERGEQRGGGGERGRCKGVR